MDAVRAVDVGVAGRPEHRGRARSQAAKAVARGIVLVVGFDLDDPPAHAVDEQGGADQLGRDLVHRAREELARQPLASHRAA